MALIWIFFFFLCLPTSFFVCYHQTVSTLSGATMCPTKRYAHPHLNINSNHEKKKRHTPKFPKTLLKNTYTSYGC